MALLTILAATGLALAPSHSMFTAAATAPQDRSTETGPVTRRDRPADPRLSVAIPRVQQSARIDGVLDDETWKEAARLDGFTEYEPTPGAQPRDSTVGLVA